MYSFRRNFLLETLEIHLACFVVINVLVCREVRRGIVRSICYRNTKVDSGSIHPTRHWCFSVGHVNGVEMATLLWLFTLWFTTYIDSNTDKGAERTTTTFRRQHLRVQNLKPESKLILRRVLISHVHVGEIHQPILIVSFFQISSHLIRLYICLCFLLLHGVCAFIQQWVMYILCRTVL